MAGLSADSLETVAKLTGLEGSGKTHSTPMFYKGLIELSPSLVRTITNVSYNGVNRIPKNGPAILVGNHTSHIDPIVKIMGAKRPVHYLAKAEHFEDKKFQKLMTSTGQASAASTISSPNSVPIATISGFFPSFMSRVPSCLASATIMDVSSPTINTSGQISSHALQVIQSGSIHTFAITVMTTPR